MDELGDLLARLRPQPLEGWDLEFVEDLVERHKRWGVMTQVSVKQQEQIDRIRDKYLTEDEAVSEEIETPAEDPAPGAGHNSGEKDSPYMGGINAGQLESFIQRIENLEEEKANLATDIREIFAEAKAQGYDVKIMRQVLKLRKMDPDDVTEQQVLLEVYARALGMDFLL